MQGFVIAAPQFWTNVIISLKCLPYLNGQLPLDDGCFLCAFTLSWSRINSMFHEDADLISLVRKFLYRLFIIAFTEMVSLSPMKVILIGQ